MRKSPVDVFSYCFRHEPSLTYRDVPPPYFQFLSFDGDRPTGSVEYDPAFQIGTL